MTEDDEALSDIGEDDESGSPKRKREDPIAKRVRLEKESRELQSALSDGVISDLKTRIGWILNLFPHTRNSDVALTIKYWEMFQPDIFNATAMSPRDLFRLERESYIVRVRAKIQNEYNLFPADAQVRRQRRSREEDMKEDVVEDKPAQNKVFVFSDETGKNATWVCVAAVWVLTGYALFKVSRAIDTWQDKSPWAKHEMHFSEFRKNQLDALAEYLDIVLQNREFLSFKVIAVERAKQQRSIEETVQRLHEFMLVRGAEHEITSNRIKLPHAIQLTVDAEQSLDEIACADIKRRISDAYKSDYGDDMVIDQVTAISSHKSQMVQLADVIAGAVNRRRNHVGERGHKDDMADMIIERLGIQLNEEEIPDVDATAWLSV